jgi:hypothetical protein
MLEKSSIPPGFFSEHKNMSIGMKRSCISQWIVYLAFFITLIGKSCPINTESVYSTENEEKKGTTQMNGKKILIVFLAATLASSLNSMTALADSKKKIRTVKLEVAADVLPDNSIMHQQVEITAGNDRYEVLDYVFTNQGLEWSDADVPRLEITLKSLSEYCFETADYSFFINGGTYVNQMKEEEVDDDDDEWKQTIRVIVDLPPISERTDEIERAQWSDNHTANWTNSFGAGNYEVRLYRNGKNTGTIKRTEDTALDLARFMTRSGSYTFRVRPVNKMNVGIKGKWAEAASLYIDENAAKSNLALTVTPGVWKKNQIGWWYENEDRSYTVNDWKHINGSWYFFDEKGYMAAGWINWQGKLYYCDIETGQMLENSSTPGGQAVGSDGVNVT